MNEFIKLFVISAMLISVVSSIIAVILYIHEEKRFTGAVKPSTVAQAIASISSYVFSALWFSTFIIVLFSTDVMWNIALVSLTFAVASLLIGRYATGRKALLAYIDFLIGPIALYLLTSNVYLSVLMSMVEITILAIVSLGIYETKPEETEDWYEL